MSRVKQFHPRWKYIHFMVARVLLRRLRVKRTAPSAKSGVVFTASWPWDLVTTFRRARRRLLYNCSTHTHTHTHTSCLHAPCAAAHRSRVLYSVLDHGHRCGVVCAVGRSQQSWNIIFSPLGLVPKSVHKVRSFRLFHCGGVLCFIYARYGWCQH